MITLDEAIKHCDELAYQNKILMKRYDDASGYNRSHNEKIRTNGAKGCEQLISLYRQLAEWLRELKAYREAKDKIFKNMKVWEQTYHLPCSWDEKDINSIKIAYYQEGKADAYTDCIGICEIAFEEVNADDTNRCEN